MLPELHALLFFDIRSFLHKLSLGCPWIPPEHIWNVFFFQLEPIETRFVVQNRHSFSEKFSRKLRQIFLLFQKKIYFKYSADKKLFWKFLQNFEIFNDKSYWDTIPVQNWFCHFLQTKVRFKKNLSSYHIFTGLIEQNI